MARPKKDKDLPANLSREIRGSDVTFRYTHPTTKKRYRFGKDKAEAVQAARILNNRLRREGHDVRQVSDETPAESRRGYVELYRHYDKEGTLLYVGISLNSVARLRKHREEAHWFDDITRIEIERFESKEMAREAEKDAIAEERPLFNIMHSDT